MQKKDLKIGGYYVSNNTCEKIFKYTDPSGSENKYIIKEHKKLYQDCGGVIDLFPGTLVAPFTKATQEQIDHLDACIAAGKYVEAPKRPKFEVGKWYKNLDSSEQWIGKFEKQYSNTIDFGGYEFIDNVGEYHKISSLSYLYSKNAIEITDLQEIQQYLPEGHPDRIDTIPEYVECLEDYRDQFTKGRIYIKGSYLGSVTKDDQGDKNGWGKEKFKPSTKEAYLAQHGKSEELTELPEKRCIHLPSQKIKDFIGDLDICNVKIKDVSGGYVNYDKLYTCAKTKDTIEITFDQFKKWVLKEKSIEPWSVGTYVVFLKDYGGHPKGIVDIIEDDYSTICVRTSLKFNGSSEGCNVLKNKEAKWFATKEEAEKFAETLIDKPKGIVPQDDKWYNIEDGYGEYYIARYNGGFHSCEAIYEGEYTLDNDIESSGEYRIIAEVPSNDPKITGPLLKYAKKKYPVGTKYLYRTTEIVKGSLQYYPSPPQITDGHGGSVYFRGEWSEIVSLPEKEKEESKSTHKFKVGDSVIVSNSGYYYPTHTKAIEYGCRDSYYKENRGLENGNVLTVHKQVIINNDTVGYVVTTGTIDYLISEKGLNEFTKESKLEEANRRFKVGMIINTSYYQDRRTLVKGDFPLKEENNGCIYTRTGRCSLYDKLTDKWATIISEEKDEESWYNEITGDLKNIERKTVTIKYNNKPSLNLILFDNEPVIFSKPNKVNSINAELLIIEE